MAEFPTHRPHRPPHPSPPAEASAVTGLAPTPIAEVSAVFPDRDSADAAFRIVTEHGYETHELSVLMSEATHARALAAAPGLPTEASA